MRAIFLNSWFGQIADKYDEFIRSESSKTEIYCLQEVTPTLFTKLEESLPNHRGIFLTEDIVEILGFTYGKAIFVEKDLKFEGFGIQKLFEESSDDCGFAQPFDVETQNKIIHFNSVHGKPRPGDKTDTPVRLKQSETLINYFKDKVGPKIIGGDFNLCPETKSVRMFEEAGYRNLIRDYDIKNTRNRISWDFFKNDPVFVKQHFADYVFVSPEVKVKNFEVPYLEISDHLPLILDFEI